MITPEWAIAQPGQSRTGGIGSKAADQTPIPGRGIYPAMPQRPAAAALSRYDKARERIIVSDLEVQTFATSNDGPNDNEWGDYLTARRHFPYENTWVGSGFRLTGGGDEGDVVPEFVWFGRERDTPPATNIVYVNKNNTAGYEIGTLSNPYNTVDEGSIALQPGDVLRIEQNTYGENVLFNTDANVENRNGTVVIQGPSALSIAPADRTEEETAEVSESRLEERSRVEPASEGERRAAEQE
ncbi:MAG TPA: hypothetical protein VMO47_15625 [Rhodothermales bacterium]|nr:hypothetical protein [Rhodothermales bacterium]